MPTGVNPEKLREHLEAMKSMACDNTLEDSVFRARIVRDCDELITVCQEVLRAALQAQPGPMGG